MKIDTVKQFLSQERNNIR